MTGNNTGPAIAISHSPPQIRDPGTAGQDGPISRIGGHVMAWGIGRGMVVAAGLLLSGFGHGPAQAADAVAEPATSAVTSVAPAPAPALAPGPADQAAGAGSANAAGPVSDGDLYGAMRFMGGQYAAQNRHQILVGDFTCDGAVDRVVGWLDRDNPDGPFFDLLFVTRHGGELHQEMKMLPFDQAGEFALCIRDETAPPVISWQTVDPEYMRDVIGNEKLCAIAIRVDDFLCDAPQFYWSPSPDAKGDHWQFFRN